MPSTPYAASAANTPIASARRPTKRRPHQSISTPVRQAELSPDNSLEGKGDSGGIAIKSGGGEIVVVAAAAGGEGLTPQTSRRDIEEQQPESLSPPKARKGSTSSTPRSSGIMDSRWGVTQSTGSAGCTGGSVDTGVGVGDDKADVNRHNPKESSIFSPALRPEQHTAQASTVKGVPSEGEPEPSTASTSPALKVEDGNTQEHQRLGMEAKAAEPEVEVDVDTTRATIDGEEIKDAESKSGVVEGDDRPLDLEVREVVEGEMEGVMEEGVEEQQQQEEEDEEEEFNPYCFIAHLPPYNTVKHYTPEAPALPQKRKTRHGKELTLVLDLDETLVHCTVDPINNPDHRFDVHFNGEEFQVYVRKRPHLDAFLEAVSELFEVVVFTASQQVYAERLLNMIDPQKKFVKYRLYRDACMTLEGNYLKDLNVLGRDLSKVAIVDNSPYAYGFQIDNGIPIESWFDDTSDEELLHLLPLLKQLIHESEAAGGDVRPFIRNLFKTHELVDKARNGTRDFASPMHQPLPPSSTVSSEEEDVLLEEADENQGTQEALASEGHPIPKKQIVAAE